MKRRNKNYPKLNKKRKVSWCDKSAASMTRFLTIHQVFRHEKINLNSKIGEACLRDEQKPSVKTFHLKDKSLSRKIRGKKFVVQTEENVSIKHFIMQKVFLHSLEVRTKLKSFSVFFCTDIRDL